MIDSGGRAGSFNEAISALRIAKNVGFKVCVVNFLFTRENKDELPAMLDLLVRERIRHLAILSYRDVSENLVQPEAIPLLSQLEEAWMLVTNWLATHPFPQSVEIVVPSFLHPQTSVFRNGLAKNLRRKITFRHPHLRGQSAFKSSVVIKPLGGVTGDTAMINSELFEIGSVSQTPISELWSYGALMWRRRLVEREEVLRKLEPCRDCTRWNVCRGGCAAAAFHQSGRLDSHDRSCDAFRDGGAFLKC